MITKSKNPPTLMNMAAVCQKAQRSYLTVYRHAIEGKLRCHQAGAHHQLLFEPSAVDDYIADLNRTSKKKVGR